MRSPGSSQFIEPNDQDYDEARSLYNGMMFPVELARQAQAALPTAGAVVTYREVDDLSHCYPRELNGTLLGWLETAPPKRAALAE